MNKLAEKYNKELRAQIKTELELSNVMAVPKLEKIVLNIGVGRAIVDKQWIEFANSILIRITGQKPVNTKVKKAISNFKIREGQLIGSKVTLRGVRMYDFLERFINITLPRLRDFYGLDPKKGFDGRGNYTIGFKEHIVFPEIGMDDLEKTHGLELTIVTTAKDNKGAMALLKALGLPFKKDKK